MDLTIIKTEKVDIELFPSPGERRVPSAPRSPCEGGGRGLAAGRGDQRGRRGVFGGCLWKGNTERTPSRSAAAPPGLCPLPKAN